MSSWFDIDNAGWKRMNAGRPPYELVKELIQNVLDESFNIVNIDYEFKDNVFSLCIEDDIEGGFANSSLITTVFMTSKEDSHLKRGRKGRGLKEFLSVCKTAKVETVGKTVEFCSDSTRKEYVNNRTVGTKISCAIVEEGWNQEAVISINNFLKRVIVYSGKIFVNGKLIKDKVKIAKKGHCYLMTQIIRDNKQIDISEYTTISIYDKSDKDGWIYEMGIPVCTTDIPYDVDIHQRIPLNDNRNEIGKYYLKMVKLYVVQALIDQLSKKDYIGWASETFNSYYNYNIDERKVILSKFINDKTLVKSKSRIVNDRAKQKGFELFDIGMYNDGLKDFFENEVKLADKIISDIEKFTKELDVEPTETEFEFISKLEDLIKKAIDKEIKIGIIEKPKDIVSDNVTLAIHGYNGDLPYIKYNRIALSKKVFENPYGEKALDILIHELGHEDSNEHEFNFINAVTKYAGKIASYLANNKKDKKVTKTLKEEIKKVLNHYYYISLSEIYEKLDANTLGEKAAIRGILNKECSISGIFDRHCDGAKYRLIN
jgi:hypothetical protein